MKLCKSGVAYAFLTHKTIVVWPVWQQYFETCPLNSFTIAVHSQSKISDPLKGVSMIEDKNVIQGNLRFEWDMIRATFALYRQLSSTPTKEGCVPPWIQLLSGDSAPLMRCDRFHDSLRDKRSSRLQTCMDTFGITS